MQAIKISIVRLVAKKISHESIFKHAQSNSTFTMPVEWTPNHGKYGYTAYIIDNYSGHIMLLIVAVMASRTLESILFEIRGSNSLLYLVRFIKAGTEAVVGVHALFLVACAIWIVCDPP